MPDKAVYLLAVDGFADWEPAHAVAELRTLLERLVAPAVRDRKLITASGLADVEFARELLEELDVLTPADRELWAGIFRSAKLPSGG